MKTLLLVLITVFLWLPPASVQCGSNQVDLTGKGTSHLPQSGKDTLATGRKVQNLHRAQQGQKALDDVMKQHQKNQEDMKRCFNYMNRNR